MKKNLLALAFLTPALALFPGCKTNHDTGAYAPVIIACASTYWRNAWKYQSRAYRHCFWDCGTILANLLAVAAAIPLGLFFGRFSRCHQAIDPLLQVLRPISPIAWFPLAVLWFGIGNLPAIVIIFLAAFYPVLLSTVTAVRNVPPVYLKVADNFGASRRKIFRDVIIPAAFPQITVGLHIAIGSAWVFLVAGEMLGVRSGLGYLIIDSRNNLRTDLVIVGILLIGLSGLLVDRIMGLAERWVKRQWGAL